MRFLALAFALLINTNAFAAPERQDLVHAAHHLLNPGLKTVMANLKPSSSLFKHRSYLQTLIELTEKGLVSLRFVDNFDSVTFKNAPSNRFMGTGFDDSSPILVSKEVLNAPTFTPPGVKPLNFILQTLVHEYLNKIEGLDQAIKDSIASQIADLLDPYETVIEAGQLRVLLFSIPSADIDTDLANTAENEVQPTFAVLIETADGSYSDLTKEFSQKAASTSPALRSGWTEANRLFLAIMPQLMGMMMKLQPMVRNQMNIMVEKFKGFDANVNVDNFTQKFDQLIGAFNFFSKGELRILNLHDAAIETAENGGIHLTVQATYSLDRSGIEVLKNFEEMMGEGFTVEQTGGIDQKKILETPLLFKLQLTPVRSGVKVAHISVDVRPELNYAKIARVGRITRVDNQIRTLVVKVEATGNPRVAELRLTNEKGSTLIPAAKIVSQGAQSVNLEFNLPESWNTASDIWTDSILLDQVEGRMLNRLVKVSEGSSAATDASAPPAFENFVIPAKDLNGIEQPLIAFHPFLPVLVTSPDWYEFLLNFGTPEKGESTFWIGLKDFQVYFSAPGRPKVREVRVQMTQEVGAGQPKPEDLATARKGEVTVDGVKIPVWTTVEIKQQDHVYSILSIPTSGIESRFVNGKTLFRATGPLLFHELPKKLDAGDGYGPVMVRPIKVEVVLDDFTTVTHEFPSLNLGDCESALRGEVRASDGTTTKF